MKITSPKPQLKKIQQKQQQSQWQILINSLVRPPRMRYNESHMGFKTLKLNSQTYHRKEETILHEITKKIYLSLFVPETCFKKIILYLHGNSSSKVEGKSLLPYLPRGWALASFDFIGCGNNMEEDVISLGFRQASQVQTVVSYLKNQGYQVALWGRSMGAVSALLYGKSEVIIADSPFRSMKKLCKELSTKKSNPVPNCIVGCLFPCVFMKLRSDIKQKGRYDIQQLNTQKAVKNINPATTLVFLCGNKDDLVHHRNSQKLFEIFTGSKKYLELVQGDHNSKRPDQVVKKIMHIIDRSYETEMQTKQGFLQQEQIDFKLNL